MATPPPPPKKKKKKPKKNNIILFQQLWLSHLSYADTNALLCLTLTLGVLRLNLLNFWVLGLKLGLCCPCDCWGFIFKGILEFIRYCQRFWLMEVALHFEDAAKIENIATLVQCLSQQWSNLMICSLNSD